LGVEGLNTRRNRDSEFGILEHLRYILERYFRFYNQERIHSRIGSPERFLRKYQNEEERLVNTLNILSSF